MYDKEDIRRALETLRSGGVILYPTDTVWGIGCDARNDEAVRRIFAIKHREDAKAMLCLIDSPARLTAYVREVPDMAWELIPIATRPLTIIYPNARNVAPSLLAEDGSLGIRVCEEPFCAELSARLHAPIVSTSANIAGEPTPRCFSEISEEVVKAVDYVVQYRQNDKQLAQPSQIIKLGVHNEVKIIRQ